ncbi:MAG: hypothetical protein ACR2QF_12470, partial [Geminicoccaceae bacterium]
RISWPWTPDRLLGAGAKILTRRGAAHRKGQGTTQGGSERELSRDKGTRRVVMLPVQASSSVSTDVPHRSSPSSSPDLDCKAMKSLDNF